MMGYLHIRTEIGRRIQMMGKKEEDEQPESSGYRARPSLPMKEGPNIEEYINQTKQKWKQGYEGLAEGNTWGYNIYYTKPLESDKEYELIW